MATNITGIKIENVASLRNPFKNAMPDVVVRSGVASFGQEVTTTASTMIETIAETPR